MFFLFNRHRLADRRAIFPLQAFLLFFFLRFGLLFLVAPLLGLEHVLPYSPFQFSGFFLFIATLLSLLLFHFFHGLLKT